MQNVSLDPILMNSASGVELQNGAGRPEPDFQAP